MRGVVLDPGTGRPVLEQPPPGDARFGRDGSVAFTVPLRKRDLPAHGEDLREAVQRHEFYERIQRYLELARAHPALVNVVPGNAYTVHSGASAVALAAATAKTVLNVIAGTANPPAISEMCVGFDGVTASAVVVLVELAGSTQAATGTSTAFTPTQLRGWPAAASQSTAANAYTVEPTVLVTKKFWTVDPNKGLLVLQYPLGKEPTGLVTAATDMKAIPLRCTAPAIVNCRAYYEYDE